MKIVIVGAGIGGLSTYLSLHKFVSPSLPSLTVTIYESHKSSSSTNFNFGGGMGLAPNGLRAIGSICPDAARYIQDRGYPGALFTIRNASGRLLGNLSMGRSERYGGYGTLMLRRAVVHRALLDQIPDEAVVWGKKVTSVEELKDCVRVVFEDETKEIADLVIGADGVRSVVREHIFNSQHPAVYDGLASIGGFIPLSLLPKRLLASLNSEGVTMTFGSHGFFGYSLLSPPTPSPHSDPYLQWWSIYETPTPPDRTLSASSVREQLLARHAAWISPHDAPDARVYESIILLGCQERDVSEIALDKRQKDTTFFVLPRYVVPRIPTWTTPSGSGRIILLGDAAHAMPPDSGQGVSCAVEDSVALGLLLRHFLFQNQDQDKFTSAESNGPGSAKELKETGKAYEDVRMRRVWKILDIAKKSGDSKKKLSMSAELLRDVFFWLFCRFPEKINDDVFGYHVEKEVEKYLASKR